MFRENECKKLFSRVDWGKLKGTLIADSETLLSRVWQSFYLYIGAGRDSYYKQTDLAAAGVDRRFQWIWMWEECEWKVNGSGFESRRCWSGPAHGFDSDDLTEIKLTKVSIITSGWPSKCYRLLFCVTGRYQFGPTLVVKTGFDQGLTFEVQVAGMSIGLEWRWNGVGIDLEITWRWLVLLIKRSWPGLKILN